MYIGAWELLSSSFEGLPNLRCKNIWKGYGTAKTPPNGYEYKKEAGEVYMQYDLPDFVSDDDFEDVPKLTALGPPQQGDRPETITDRSTIVLRSSLRWWHHGAL